jgi:hypothetical protein
MKLTEQLTPVAAVAAALAAFACCVPLGFAGAIGVLALSPLFDGVQPWLVSIAVVLLALGAYQAFRRQRTCGLRRTRFSLVVLGLSATIVLGVLLFPQLVAGLIADYLL